MDSNKREVLRAICRRNCSCDTGRCSVCHIERAAEAVIQEDDDKISELKQEVSILRGLLPQSVA